jgi:membrane protease YdiL (CAAX protease family)
VWLAIGVAVVGVIVTQVVGAIGLVLWYFATGGTQDRLMADFVDLATMPVAVIFMAGLSQLAIVAVAICAAWLSPQPVRQRLGLVRPSLSNWTIAMAVVGSLVPLAIGVGLALWLKEYMEPDPSIKTLYEKMTPATSVPFILFIALAPGFCEEILFRGYVQRRFLERWSAWVALLVTSVIFGVFHVMPHAILAAFPLGLWFGVLAWRSGSIWPGILCHAAVNGAWNVRNVGMKLGFFPEEMPTVVLIALLSVGALAFGWSVWAMIGTGHKFPSDGRDLL